ALEAEEARYPALAKLRIDLTGAVARRDYRPTPPVGAGRPGLTVAQLDIVGRPVHYGQAAFVVQLSGHDVHLELVQDELGRTILNPVDASRGHLTSHIGQNDLQALIFSEAKSAAAAHGVAIEQTEL